MYSHAFARWAARALLADASLRHAVSVIARTVRLMAIRPGRLRAQMPGALLRLCAMLVRDLPRSRHAPAAAPEVQSEIAEVLRVASEKLLDGEGARAVEERMCAAATALWPLVGSRTITAERQATVTTHPVRDLGA